METTTVFLLCALLGTFVTSEKVLYAINLGGDAHEGSDGILYQADLSDHGKGKLPKFIQGAVNKDQEIYRTYAFGNNLDFDLPTAGDGDYLLLLKFADNWEDRSQVVIINGHHKVVDRLDIYEEAGPFSAYDKTIPFKVQGDELLWRDEVSVIVDETIKFQLINTKPGLRAVISAIALKFGRPESLGDLNQPMRQMAEQIGEMVGLMRELVDLLKNRTGGGSTNVAVDNEL
jgi:Malectin domain